MPVVVTNIAPQPRVDLRSEDFATGAPVRVTTYRGVVVLEHQRTGGMEISRVPEANPISFFLPDSLPYKPGKEAALSATAAVSMQPISGGSSAADGPYGVHSCSASLVDDPGGAGVRWVAVNFVNTYARSRTEVTYEVTVVVPA
jgi:hypothetical protein